jgi:acyl-CoA hydrolase
LHQPIYIGDLVTLKASLNMVGKTSMEVGVRVESEDPRTGEVRWVASAYLTYVALGEDRRPMPVPALILETEEDIQRNCEAMLRREARNQAKEKADTCCSGESQNSDG